MPRRVSEFMNRAPAILPREGALLPWSPMTPRAASLLRGSADCCRDRRDFPALLLDGRHEFRRCAGACHDPEWWQPVADRLHLGDGPDVPRQAITQLGRHSARPEEAGDAVESQVGKAGF